MSTADEIGAKEKPICLRLCVCVSHPICLRLCVCVCVCVCVWQRVFVLCVVIALTFVSVGVGVSRCCHPSIHSFIHSFIPLAFCRWRDMIVMICVCALLVSVFFLRGCLFPCMRARVCQAGWLAGLAAYGVIDR
eukprot:GHVU01189234.1.p1 GENE.GHVU01189234.1~~GHVU01189234.1.p1  ORF type:complete len:155 (+),score=10.51 GHVU01189234.1:65-466(+)